MESGTMSARAYGVLATSFNEALRAAREALEEHSNLLPEGRLSDLDSLLAEFARRRVRIAIYGEVKAGKSTLLNALAGAELSPAAFDPLTSVPVRVTYGKDTAWHVDGRSFTSVDELASLMRGGVVDAREVVVQTDLDLLQLGGQVDLEDTPGVGAEARFDSISAGELAALDAVLVVVRYPALFTRYTRDLVRRLEGDIGKLFVVWNLDAACDELSPEERSRQAENLRANVAGAHELFLVNARAAFLAGQQGDSAGIERSGLVALRDGLGRFVSSEAREVTALREAAKRAHLWLEEAARVLTEREAVLETQIGAARKRLEEAQSAADAQSAAERDLFVSFQKAVEGLGKQHATRATSAASGLRKALRRARWRWVRRGDLDALRQAVEEGLVAYAAAIDDASATTVEFLREASREIETVVPIPVHESSQPEVANLSPQDRSERAVTGGWQVVRRAFWARWYLPGLVELERRGIKKDLAKQATWFESTAQAAGNAGRAVLDAKLADIKRRVTAELERIRKETNLAANETESERVKADRPVVAEQGTAVADINREARSLITA